MSWNMEAQSRKKQHMENMMLAGGLTPESMILIAGTLFTQVLIIS